MLNDIPSQEMKLRRVTLTDKSTIGELYLPDGSFHSFVLEDVCRDFKIAKETAIPAGRYEIILGWSNRYQQPMPRLLNVPYFTGIMIHPGNTAVDTHGCLLVGRKKADNIVLESRPTFDDLYPRIRKMTEKSKLFIEIEGGIPAAQWKEAV